MDIRLSVTISLWSTGWDKDNEGIWKSREEEQYRGLKYRRFRKGYRRRYWETGDTPQGRWPLSLGG
ncbi:MAG: hypothetical protein KAR39_00445 [Thermoplasmata archaeon]|nr:hypothetical protein [Thermoplasmata archaeon]